jgi:uncharacterized protein (DUF362 family)/Pyruvate/2-oxoacid:ferredoxin oxidoreductase delta subunit
MSSVALVRCESYEYGIVKAAVQRGLRLLGGAARFAGRGEKILLKVNLLAGDAPEKCVTTHPSVLRAAGEILKETGAQLYYGDSPSFGSTHAAARKSGLTGPAKEAGIQLLDFGQGEPVSFAEGRQNKKFIIARAVLESDGVVSLPKLKTHAFLKFTGCIKNQFGCIPGVLKAEFHVKLYDPDDFARMLVDLDRFVHPRLYIMDGVYAMEGNGPRGGAPRKMNVLLFSEDPVALDATACRLINVDPASIPTTRFGQEAGRGTYEKDAIELLGDDFQSFRAEDFAIDRTPIRPPRRKGLRKMLNAVLVPKPVINRKRCVRCGMCVAICPVQPKAVNWKSGDTSQPPRHDYGRCIRCYCCQEVCPEKAIIVQKPLLRKLLIRQNFERMYLRKSSAGRG